MSKLKPFINIGPGNIIKRNLDALNWSQQDLAEIIGMSEKTVSLVLNNRQSVTVETSRLLAKAFNSSPEFWLNLEQNYRLRLKKEGVREKETGIKAEIRKYMPVLEMRKKGWIDCGKSFQSQKKAFLNFWGINDLDYSMYDGENIQYCPRQGRVDETYTKYYMLTWLQMARKTARKIKPLKYDKNKLAGIINKIPEYSRAKNGEALFIEALKDAGVIFFVLSHLQKTYLDGACFNEGDNPVIVYTARHNRADNFWFTMAHEIAHVLLHLNKENTFFMDNLEELTENAKENQADKLARKTIGVEEIINEAKSYKNYFSENRLNQLSEKFKIHPSLALGILQFCGIIDYRTLNRHKISILDKIPAGYILG